ncbi:CBU_0592 family membrane protein [Kineosporia babensis]|uniref:CBU-0592-like domain-containing protein n=1 Tax=Kineosporia babensis TaxID=499548 RepID=A0A9X1STL5_9ACTN|nr:hypothetical protein [Kineosporia babensis]MCD5311967.1 hypothetical protein [Kineosporia babensis]
MAALLGWLGTVGTLGAYVLLCRGRWSATSLRYSLLNGIGGTVGALGSAMYGAWPSVASNLVWAAIGLHAVVVELLERRRAKLATQQLSCNATDFVPAS